MSITLIDAAEGRVLARHVHIENREPTIAEDIAEILHLEREMKEETTRVAAAQEAFWALCRARIVERLSSST